MPVAGTFRDLFVNIATAPGVGRGDRIFPFVKNGTAQSLSVTIAEGATSGNDTSNTFTVAKGDRVSLRSRVTAMGGFPAATYVSFGAVFVPDVPDYFLVGMNDSDSVKTGTGTEYHQPASGGGGAAAGWNASSTGTQTITHRVEHVSMQTYLSALPSSGTWTFDMGWTDGPTTKYTSGSAQVQSSTRPKIHQDATQFYARCGAAATSATVAYVTMCLACRVPQPTPPWLT
jgi:hypothetical protein